MRSDDEANAGRHLATEPIALAQSATLRVLIVDDEASVRKVMAVVLTQLGVSCETAANAEEALRVLEKREIDAVISDLQMPGKSGMELLANVRQSYPQMVFLMVTGVDDTRVGIQAMRQGADDYLVKPLQVDANIVLASLTRALHVRRLEKEVENYRHHLEEIVAEQTQQLREALRQIERSYDHTLEVLGAAIDLRDSPTAGHSRRVFLYSIEIAKAMGGLEKQMRNIAMGAWLHDIGKLAISDAILLKPGPLTDEERESMQRHAQIGYDLVAVADTFDAMTSDRPYRRALPFEASREVIERGTGKQYDSQVARVFLSIPGETWEVIRRETAAIQAFAFATASDIQALSKLVKSGG
jgi:response regulator RpfG family c-di-GMP phosphodiesterase